MTAVGLLMDELGDAEVDCVEVRQLRLEVTKLRKLLVVKLCDCRRLASTLPLEPLLHTPACRYRSALQ